MARNDCIVCLKVEDCFEGDCYEGALAMTALNRKVEDCFVREGYEGALAMTILEKARNNRFVEHSQ